MYLLTLVTAVLECKLSGWNEVLTVKIKFKEDKRRWFLWVNIAVVWGLILTVSDAGLF